MPDSAHLDADADERVMPGRLLQVTASNQRRGAEIHAAALGSALADRGWTVETVAVRASPDGLDFSTLGSGRRGVSTLRDLRRRLSKNDIAIGHGSASLMACAASFSKTPFVYRSIGDPSFWLASRSRRVRVAAYLRRARCIVALWPGAARFFVERLGVEPSKLEVIPNAVEEDAFRPPTADDRRRARRAFGLDSGDQVVLYLGALSREKNPALALEATAGVEGARLLVAGSGPLEPELKSAGVGRRIVWAGPVDDPVSVLQAADVLVVSSDTEGMPAVIIEAALMGVPTVATAVGAIPEMVLDGITGRVTRPGDAREFRATLVETLADVSSMGEAARAHVLANFSLSAASVAWDDLLHRHLG